MEPNSLTQKKKISRSIAARIIISYKCDPCLMIFPNLSRLKVHTFLKHVCLTCKQFFTNPKLLLPHVIEDHAQFLCSLCPKVFITGCDLFTHCALVHRSYVTLACFYRCWQQQGGYTSLHLYSHMEKVALEYLDDPDMPFSDMAEFDVVLKSNPLSHIELPILLHDHYLVLDPVSGSENMDSDSYSDYMTE